MAYGQGGVPAVAGGMKQQLEMMLGYGMSPESEDVQTMQMMVNWMSDPANAQHYDMMLGQGLMPGPIMMQMMLGKVDV